MTLTQLSLFPDDIPEQTVSCLGARCPQRRYPSCENSLPCCKCDEQTCNSRQPCPLTSGIHPPMGEQDAAADE